MDETYIRVKGQWVYLYRAVDKFGQTIDFMLSKKRDKAVATKFFARALAGHWFAAQDRHRQKRREYRRYYRHQQNADAVRLLDNN